MVKLRTLLNEYQLNAIYKSYSDNTSKKLVKFYNYLIYLSDDGKLEISLDSLSNRWNSKKRTKFAKETCVAKTTLYRWIKKLEEINLLKVEKIDNGTNFGYCKYKIISE